MSRRLHGGLVSSRPSTKPKGFVPADPCGVHLRVVPPPPSSPPSVLESIQGKSKAHHKRSNNITHSALLLCCNHHMGVHLTFPSIERNLIERLGSSVDLFAWSYKTPVGAEPDLRALYGQRAFISTGHADIHYDSIRKTELGRWWGEKSCYRQNLGSCYTGATFVFSNLHMLSVFSTSRKLP